MVWKERIKTVCTADVCVMTWTRHFVLFRFTVRYCTNVINQEQRHYLLACKLLFVPANKRLKDERIPPSNYGLSRDPFHCGQKRVCREGVPCRLIALHQPQLHVRVETNADPWGWYNTAQDATRACREQGGNATYLDIQTGCVNRDHCETLPAPRDTGVTTGTQNWDSQSALLPTCRLKWCSYWPFH